MTVDKTLQPADLDLSSEASPFLWLLRELDKGRDGALLTITNVRGGAPRPVGTHMAVGLGARFSGHLSGGCVEPAIAREVEDVIAMRRSRVLRFGHGSPYFDIRFPCGGGIDVLATVGILPGLIEDVLTRLAARRAFTLALLPEGDGATIIDDILPTGWMGEIFHRAYVPQTKLCLVGRGPELEAMVRLGHASGWHVDVATPDADTAMRVTPLASDVRHLRSTSDFWDMRVDRWTATVLLFHERDWEEPILDRVLTSAGFYIGALGSMRTHAARRQRLLASGHSPSLVDRVSGPIGIIHQARDPTTLALSVLGEIVLRRREAFQELETNAAG